MRLNNASAKNLRKLRQCIRAEIGAPTPIPQTLQLPSSPYKSPSKKSLPRPTHSPILSDSNGSRILHRASTKILPTSPRRVHILEKQIQTQRHSIKFYLSELNRKQSIFRQNIQEYSKDCQEQVENLENLIKVETVKNSRVEKEIEKEKGGEGKFVAIYDEMDNQELFQLYEDIRYQLYKRGLKHSKKSTNSEHQSESQHQSHLKKVKIYPKQSSFSLDGPSHLS